MLFLIDKQTDEPVGFIVGWNDDKTVMQVDIGGMFEAIVDVPYNEHHYRIEQRLGD